MGSVFFRSRENRFSWRINTLGQNSGVRLASDGVGGSTAGDVTHRGRDSSEELSTDLLLSHHSHLKTTSSSWEDNRKPAESEHAGGAVGVRAGGTHRKVPLDHLLHGGPGDHLQGQVGVLQLPHRLCVAP